MHGSGCLLLPVLQKEVCDAYICMLQLMVPMYHILPHQLRAIALVLCMLCNQRRKLRHVLVLACALHECSCHKVELLVQHSTARQHIPASRPS